MASSSMFFVDFSVLCDMVMKLQVCHVLMVDLHEQYPKGLDIEY